ncbi:hypothetical protein ACIQXU_19835 [Peribacillus sp. NPDC097284]|uniref:hypothetical protein n=1 Tax=Peribacillus sp. NPDC097284 TaxID=3364401 RepID=UPI0037FD8B64
MFNLKREINKKMKKVIKLPQSEKGKEILMKYMSDFTLISEDEQAIPESIQLINITKENLFLGREIPLPLYVVSY